mmetsp:Transcript_6458/g.15293  ORF Transcript_6458/g.15293 Transcript_6458/m.15293 type:complete len:132 (-) Transcript_6458:133-528(-)
MTPALRLGALALAVALAVAATVAASEPAAAPPTLQRAPRQLLQVANCSNLQPVDCNSVPLSYCHPNGPGSGGPNFGACIAGASMRCRWISTGGWNGYTVCNTKAWCERQCADYPGQAGDCCRASCGWACGD